MRNFKVNWRTAKSIGSKTLQAESSVKALMEIQKYLSQSEGDGIHVVSCRIHVTPEES